MTAKKLLVLSTLSLLACVSLSAVLGSIHAFSVFVPEWEKSLRASRADVSLIYSLSLVSLTIAVLFGYRIYQWLSPVVIFLCVGVLAAMGLLAASFSTSVFSLYLSYGILYGAANGLGYGYALQLSGQIMPQRRGFSMSMVTAFYAVGAVCAPMLFNYLIDEGGNTLALRYAFALTILVSSISALILKLTKETFKSDPIAALQPLSAKTRRLRLQLWIAYGAGVTAGLMVIGHAFGIAQWQHLDHEAAVWATVVIAFGNMLGGFSAGLFADRFSSRKILMYLPAISLVGLLIIFRSSATADVSSVLMQTSVIAALCLVGYSYGSIIAVFPVMVSDVFGTFAAPRIYGQLFTAWGVAGFLGPWCSGWLYDLSGSYSVAIAAAIALCIVSSIMMRIGNVQATTRD